MPKHISDNSIGTWQDELRLAIRDRQALLEALNLPLEEVDDCGFPILVPRPLLTRIEKNNPNDPILAQVLSSSEESLDTPGFTDDPLEERLSNPHPGLVHKYQSRVLLIVSGQCAVNCRYCFRRHFPYGDNRRSQIQWKEQVSQIGQNPKVNEIILSGGDPLILNDSVLANLFSAIESSTQVSRVRIHTRLPLVIPSRITESLLNTLRSARFKIVMVWHINHPNEIDQHVIHAANSLKAAGVVQLNQSVLLKGINDDSRVLAELSEKLFEADILPYYLHLLDHVKGAAHFLVSDQDAKTIYRALCDILPGFLTPKLAREIAGRGSKTTFGNDCL